MNEHNRILAYCTEQDLSDLAAKVLNTYHAAQIKIVSGPQQGLVMLRQRESVAQSQFNAGEILVTEVRLELAGHFGFGIVIGDQPRSALAIALIDAALSQDDSLTQELHQEIARLGQKLDQHRRETYRRVAHTKVAFETF